MSKRPGVRPSAGAEAPAIAWFRRDLRLADHAALHPWQAGEAHSGDTLVDADLANNAVSRQRIAGCGIDARPLFRVFNPASQGQRFDPDGAYVRAWVPERARLPDRFIYAPWSALPAVLAGAGVALGRAYPHPIVDLPKARQRALDAYRAAVRRVAA